MHIILWPEEIIELNRELATDLHPKLVALLHGLPESTAFQDRIAHIAAYCGLVVDGMYDPEQIAKLCALIIPRLQEKRERPGGIIYLN